MKDDSPPAKQTFEETRQREREEHATDQPGAVRDDDARGRRATSPGGIPARGWGEILKRAFANIAGDHLTLVAAGVAFFFLLGLFPGLAAVVSIYGWIADPNTVAGHVDEVAAVLPGDVADIVRNQIESIAADSTAAGWGAVISVLLAIWAGSKAMKGMVQALNIAYNQKESRGMIKQQVVYLSLTLLAVVVGIVSILLIAIVPAVVDFLPIPDWGGQALVWLRWPLLLVVGVAGVATIYRYGPSREAAQWKWVSWGAGGATVLWLIASALFSLYVSSFGNFNETYGSLGAVVVLMMWLYLTAFLILMGAEVDSEAELQTKHDTTGGEDAMGSRGAYVADHVATDQ